MRVNTITCHDVYNVGAALQAYALCRYLRERGHDAHIIDYKPDYLSGHYRLWGGVSPGLTDRDCGWHSILPNFPGARRRVWGGANAILTASAGRTCR